MKYPIITFSAAAAANHQPSLISPSFLDKIQDDSDTSCTYVVLNAQPGEFAEPLAHEFRNPLGHIKLSIEMLTSLIEDKDLKVYLDVIMRNSDRLSNLINALLDRAFHPSLETKEDSIDNAVPKNENQNKPLLP